MIYYKCSEGTTEERSIADTNTHTAKITAAIFAYILIYSFMESIKYIKVKVTGHEGP
jgi:hypothetical protein